VCHNGSHNGLDKLENLSHENGSHNGLDTLENLSHENGSHNGLDKLENLSHENGSHNGLGSSKNLSQGGRHGSGGIDRPCGSLARGPTSASIRRRTSAPR